MRLVLDTNVVASALLWGGVPRLLLQAGHEQSVDLFTSMPLLAELTDILNRRKFDRKIAASLLTVDRLVDGMHDSRCLYGPNLCRASPPDPDDDVVIGTALAAKADLIVTGGRPLLAVAEYLGVRMHSIRQAVEILGMAS